MAASTMTIYTDEEAQQLRENKARLASLPGAKLVSVDQEQAARENREAAEKRARAVLHSSRGFSLMR